MCGIVGQCSYSTKVQIEDLRKMTDVIAHRGPDGEGHWLNSTNNVGFGHRRLSILDLSQTGSQPMHSKCGRYTITFNGEIYNYLELKSSLFEEGYNFKSSSDTEVLLELFAKEGKECLKRLNGMFAFAIWDDENSELFCARDRFGEKPFYYHFENGVFSFASEIKAFWEIGIQKKINEGALYNYLMYELIEDPTKRESTFYDNIYKLDIASYITINSDGILIKKSYWSLDEIQLNTEINFEDAKKKFLDLLTDSISIRMRSDVSIGSSLSGGLDSSAIVCIINKIKTTTIKQKTFSARFKNFDKDEGKFIERVLKCIDADSYYTWPDGKKLASDFYKLCFHQEEPFGSASVFAQWEVMKLAKQNNIKVLLDGQGADEQLAGYHFYLNEYYRTLKKQEPNLFKNELNAYFIKNGICWNKPMSVKILNEFPNLHAKILWIKKIFNGFDEAKYLSKDFYDKFKNKPKPFVKISGMKNMLKHSLMKGGLQELLRYADKNSMAHSVEVRLPFLDYRLVEFVLSLPDSFIIKNAYDKFIMREALYSIIPQEIVMRKDKIGFEPPQKNWLKELNNNCYTENKYYSNKILLQKFYVSCQTLFIDQNYHRGI